ncbi:unnamed protein product, partial [Rotaria sp. Silwood2]
SFFCNKNIFNLGSLSIKECEKVRKKRDPEKVLLEIQANAVNVKG